MYHLRRRQLEFLLLKIRSLAKQMLWHLICDLQCSALCRHLGRRDRLAGADFTALASKFFSRHRGVVGYQVKHFLLHKLSSGRRRAALSKYFDPGWRIT